MLKGGVFYCKAGFCQSTKYSANHKELAYYGLSIILNLANSLKRWLRRIQNLINFYAHLNFSFCSVCLF